MIEDLGSGHHGAVTADVCLIGAGAAGITIARALARSNLRVCLLESGGLRDEPETQKLYDGVNVGHPMVLDEGRYRVFGGSTTRWTGRCAKLDAIDFEARPWLGLDGWPIAPVDLEPFNRGAEEVCGFADAWVDDDLALAQIGVDAPAFNPAEITPFVWRYAPRGKRVYVDWGKSYREELERAANVRVLLHANVVALESAVNEGAVSAALVRSLNGASARIEARTFVLCASGVENARLLLASPIGAPGGAGNRHDQVGRYFQQHPRGRVGALHVDAKQARQLQDRFNIFTRSSGTQYEQGFALSAEAQRREELLNASAILTYDADPHSGWESAKSAARGLTKGTLEVGDVARALAGADDVASNALRLAQGRHTVLETRAINLIIDLEQLSNPESRITLDVSTDPFGLPRARVDWRLSELERTTARYFAERLRDEFARLDIGALRLEPWLTSEAPLTEDHLAGTYHFLCATRMSTAPERGVVDTDCRVHGVSNLYAAGGSVFASGAHANPTFTIVALALRLADHLRATLNESLA